MKNFVKAIICGIIAIAMIIPTITMAADTPQLKTIQFYNAKLDMPFSPSLHEYGITLYNPSESPAVENFQIEGDADVLINYDLDEAMHQTAIVVTLEYPSGSNIYRFEYSNAEYTPNSNNKLVELGCVSGELYPALSDDVSDYKLYIPNDMTEVNLITRTADPGAHCELPTLITIKPEQELNLSIPVIASDGSIRTYTVKIKHLDKTSDEVAKEMTDPEFTSLLEGEMFYQKPEFVITIACVAGGLILLAIFIAITKRLTVKVNDDDEEEFFVIEEASDSEE